MHRLVAFTLATLNVLYLWLPAAESQEASAQPVSFARDVQPILASRCYACHGPDVAESGLALHERDLALALTDTEQHALVAGEPAESELLRRVSLLAMRVSGCRPRESPYLSARSLYFAAG